MTIDRTVKLLLFSIALALWGLLLRPAFTPVPVNAQGSSSSELVVVGEGQLAGLFLLRQGDLYRFSPNDLSLQAKAVYDPAKQTYVNHAP